MSWRGKTISRRAMLRGSSVLLALPLFESMLDGNGTALASGAPLPVRYGLYFWANGLPWTIRHRGTLDPNFRRELPDTLIDEYTPLTEGKGFAVTPTLRPLERHLANINVVTGLEPKTNIPTSPPLQEDGHMRGVCVALTADQARSEGFDHDAHIFAVNRATLDQYIAKHPRFYSEGPPRYRSLELGVSTSLYHDFGTWTAVSHNGPNSLNPPQRNPQLLFEQLFATRTGEVETSRSTSVLHAVAEDARQLRSRLGKRDRERLDEHLTHISEIERRLHAARVTCTAPGAPAELIASESKILEKAAIMSDLLVAALRCDLTRVFTFVFTPAATHFSMNAAGEIGGSGAIGLHDAAHTNEREIVKLATEVNLSGYAILLDKLAAEKDVNGQSLLDGSVIMGTSEYGEGYTHSTKEHPFIFAGKAGGRLDTGWHVREEAGNSARAHLTALRALGLEEESYGFNGGETSSPLPFLI
jgi:hypothetical protein